jgi:hypothetical protein
MGESVIALYSRAMFVQLSPTEPAEAKFMLSIWVPIPEEIPA